MIKSVIFVTGSLADGGAEKVMSILASGCAELGADVTKSGYVEISMGISKCIIMDRNYSADTEILWGGAE